MDVDICPPYWPEIIWWLLHHHGPPPPPPDGVEAFDRLFANLAVVALAKQTNDAELGKIAVTAARRSLEAVLR